MYVVLFRLTTSGTHFQHAPSCYGPRELSSEFPATWSRAQTTRFKLDVKPLQHHLSNFGWSRSASPRLASHVAVRLVTKPDKIILVVQRVPALVKPVVRQLPGTAPRPDTARGDVEHTRSLSRGEQVLNQLGHVSRTSEFYRDDPTHRACARPRSRLDATCSRSSGS